MEGLEEQEKGHEQGRGGVEDKHHDTCGWSQETEAQSVIVGHIWGSRRRLYPLDKPRQQDGFLQSSGSLHPAKLPQAPLQGPGNQGSNLTA